MAAAWMTAASVQASTANRRREEEARRRGCMEPKYCRYFMTQWEREEDFDALVREYVRQEVSKLENVDFSKPLLRKTRWERFKDWFRR